MSLCPDSATASFPAGCVSLSVIAIQVSPGSSRLGVYGSFVYSSPAFYSVVIRGRQEVRTVVFGGSVGLLGVVGSAAPALPGSFCS